MTMRHNSTVKGMPLLADIHTLKYSKTASLVLGMMGAGLLGAVVAALLQLLIQIKGLDTAFLAGAPCLPILLICFDRHNMTARRRFCFVVGIAMGLMGGFWCGSHAVQYFTGVA